MSALTDCLMRPPAASDMALTCIGGAAAWPGALIERRRAFCIAPEVGELHFAIFAKAGKAVSLNIAGAADGSAIPTGAGGGGAAP